MNVSTVASAAKTLIHNTSWFQGYGMPAREAHCMMTAINAVTADVTDKDSYSLGNETAAAIAGIIRAEYPERLPLYLDEDWMGFSPATIDSATVVRFNDHADTTLEDVERVFDKVAAS